MKPAHLLIPLLGIALGLFVPFEKPKLPAKKKKGAAAQVTPEIGGKWSSQRFLDKRTDEAIEWVKVATRQDFVTPPTTVIGNPADVAGFLREDLDAAFRKLGAKSDEAVAQMSRDLAARLVAAYDPKSNTIHVLPENAVAAAGDEESLKDPAVLRLVLVRMATVAMNRQLFPEWKTALDEAKTLDAVHCAGAVMEGHAQYIAERVAKQLEKDEDDFSFDSFHDLVALLTAEPAEGATAGTKAMSAEGKFAIVQGHAFMSAIARKSRPGWRGVLRKPPTDRNHIFKPQDYLALFTRAGQLPQRVLGEFAGLMPEKDGWTVAAEKCPAADVEAWMAPLEKRMWGGEVAAFEKGHKWSAKKDGAGTTLYLLEFRTGGMAESYVNLAKSAAEKSGAKVEAGAGRDGGLLGFAAKREADGTSQDLQLTAEGKYVLGFVTSDDSVGREPWDDAMEAAAELLGKAQKTRKNRRDK